MNYDVAVIGTGPAGIQAGMHSSRKKASTVLIGKIQNSAAFGTHIENHFGAIGKASGEELLKDGLSKAKTFGCTHIEENVLSIERSEGMFKITTESSELTAKAVVLAPGIHRNKLNVPGEKEFIGKGVSYCASCDCNFYKGKTVAVVGNESEAAASAELMTKYASKTYWVFTELDVSEEMVNNAKNAGVVMIDESVRTINGRDKVTSITFGDGSAVNVEGVFIELGGRSSADLAMDVDIMPTVDGLIPVDHECRTSAEGVFACGDVTGKPWQVAKAAGQGLIAGTNAAEFARN